MGRLGESNLLCQITYIGMLDVNMGTLEKFNS